MTDGDFPLADTAAVRILSEGIQQTLAREGISLRQLGRDLGYKQAVVLSHMSSGRVPIPVDRAEQLALRIGADPSAFLLAVLHQRHPSVNWLRMFTADVGPGSSELAASLESIAGTSLDGLSMEQKATMREVASDPRPARRWLSVHELPLVERLRRSIPSFSTQGVPASDLDAIEGLLEHDQIDPDH